MNELTIGCAVLNTVISLQCHPYTVFNVSYKSKIWDDSCPPPDQRKYQERDGGTMSVSYTHLDVYKRQSLGT